ncbi:4-(cytidine 5'-diphospho)-2-C-methyl-D-erythritol kinase [soil metagenome]
MDEIAKAVEEAVGVDGSSELACAKINLALHVGARRIDGYHRLESVVVFADLADVVSAVPAPKEAGTSLAIRGPFADLLGETTAQSANLAWRAADELARIAPKRKAGPVRLTLTKRIPVAGGLGGGSADAAATLRLLNRLWHLKLKPEKLAEIGLTLGADVPMCLVSQPLVARGIGEAITPLAGVPALPIVLAHPGTGMSTAQVFARLEEKERGPLPDLPAKFATPLDLIFWLRQTRNDLEAPANAVSRKATAAAKALARDPDCFFARMSGSGSAAFGVFINYAAAERAAARLAAEKRDWWVATAVTRAS